MATWRTAIREQHNFYKQLAQWQIIALCHQNQPPCQNQLSEQQPWSKVWEVINSSVWSCWLLLIEVNVGAEKYFDWWGWQEGPTFEAAPESLTWKAVCDKKVNLSLSNRPWLVSRNTEQVTASVRVCTLVLTSSSHSARSIALLNTELKVWNTTKGRTVLWWGIYTCRQDL